MTSIAPSPSNDSVVASEINSGSSDESSLFPVSFAQRRLWFLDKLQPNSALYNMPFPVRLDGVLDVSALQRALQAIVDRHEPFRTTFCTVDSEPMQSIVPSAILEMPIIDLSCLANDERKNEATRLIEADAKKPFDLARDLMLRVKLFRLSPTEHTLLVTMHHIASDGWSMGVFFRDLTAFYEAFASVQKASLPELKIQYADFAVWQRQWMEGETLQKQIEYWKKQLTGAPALLEFPLDRPRPALQTFRGATHSVKLPGSLQGSLIALSKKENATLFMTLLAAFKTLFFRSTGQEDVVVGSPIANRNRPETESLIGFFVNTLVLRTDLSGDPSFRELLRRERDVALDAYAHQDLPFEMLVEKLQPERSINYNAFFNILFVLQNARNEKLQMPGLSVTMEKTDWATSKFDFSLFMAEEENGLLAKIEYSTDLYDSTTIERMLERFQILLEGIVANPDERLSRLPLLTERERVQVLEEFNATTMDYERNRRIHDLFEAQAARTPGAAALVDGKKRLTYRELNSRANQLAHRLKALGVGPDVLVGLCVERSLEMVIAMLAILKADGAYVPLDPNYPKDRLAFVLQDSKAPVLLTQKSLLAGLPIVANDNSDHTGCNPNVLCLDSDDATVEQGSAADLANSGTSQNLAYVLYTSGSTGKPKGVQISHRAVVNFLESMRQTPGISAEDTLLAITTLSFDIAGLELFLPLIAGAQVVIAKAETAMDGKQLAEKIDQCGATILQATPATWRMLLNSGWSGNARLKILCGGEAWPEELARELLPGCASLWNMYGPTETTIWSGISKVQPNQTPLISEPIANTQFYILDAQLQPVPIGVAGELHIGGDGLARGYLNRPELTAEKFIPNPFGNEPDSRLYKTGDLVRRRSDGQIEFLGRLDDQVKIRGFRIELGEIESVLRQDPAVQDAVVAACGEANEEKRLVAYIVGNNEAFAADAPQTETNVHSEEVSHRQPVWEKTCSQEETQEDLTFNIAGWNSSYTGQPIPEAEMREWANGTIGRISSLKPRRVLELGCGTGLLLFRIAPQCEHYCATDFSAQALEQIQQQLRKSGRGLAKMVSLREAGAADLSGIEPETFDTVILNSVIYFPSVQYLMRVVERAACAVKPGGAIFIADVRSFPLLESFHASVQLHKASASLSNAELRQHVRQAMEREEELVVDPAFFLAIQQQVSRIGRVEIQLKPGRNHNELTRFRYDVILHIGQTQQLPADVIWRDWQQEQLSLAEIRQRLNQNKPDFLAIKRVPNVRLAKETAILEWIGASNGSATVGELLVALQKIEPGIEPDEFWRLGEDLSYAVQVGYSDLGNQFCDVLFQKRTADKGFPVAATEHKLNTRPWNSYANNPLKGIFARKLVPRLRHVIEKRLPHYMMPSAFVILEAMPLTPNGKVDRKALPAPSTERTEKVFVPPRDSLEQQLSGLWEIIFAIKPIGIRDNFFELGGHSLLAVRLFTDIEKITGKNLPMVTLFQAPTIESLAEILRQQGWEAPWSSLVPIKADGSRPPFYCVHGVGGNILEYLDLAKYMDDDQPFYGLQAVGLDGKRPRLETVEEMAAHYIKEIQAFQPCGPYFLGGSSFGGIVAFEMAHQFQAKGEKVALLAFFDTHAPGYPKLLPATSFWRTKLNRWKFRLSLHAGNFNAAEGMEKVSYVLKKIKKWSNSQVVQIPQWKKRLRQRIDQIFWPKTILETQKAGLRAYDSYVSKRYSGPATLFRATVQLDGFENHRALGWTEFIEGNLEIQDTPGHHGSIVRDPRARILAGQLKESLHKAQKLRA